MNKPKVVPSWLTARWGCGVSIAVLIFLHPTLAATSGAGMSRGIVPSTFARSTWRLYLEIAGECRFLNRYSVFAKLRNFNAQDECTDACGPATSEWRDCVRWYTGVPSGRSAPARSFDPAFLT